MRRTSLSGSDLAEYEQEKPARRLRPALDLGISAWCAVISIGVLVQVFFPLSADTQFYLVIFLAAVLPITLLCYRGWRVPPFLNPFKAREREGDNAGIVDWILAGVALVARVYPLLNFDGFLERRQAPTGLDVLAGAVLLVLLLEACGRTTGWVLPLVSLLIAYACYLTVVGYAVILTILYYLGILLAIEMDARRTGAAEPSTKSARKLFLRFSYRFRAPAESLISRRRSERLQAENAAETDPVPLHRGSKKAIDKLG